MSDPAPEPRPGMKPRKPKDPNAPPKPPEHPIRVSVASPQELVTPEYDELRRVVRTVLEGQGVKKAKISLALVDDATIHRLNKQFLNHDEPTDVITFPMSNAWGRPIRRARSSSALALPSNRRKSGATRSGTRSRYMPFMACYTYFGFDDIDPAERAEMRERERHWLRRVRTTADRGARLD